MGRRQEINHSLTDVGNAERFAARNAGKVLWDVEHGMWRFWDGKSWTLDRMDKALEFAIETAETICSEARAASSKFEAAALDNWANRSLSAARLAAMLKLARVQPSMTLESKQWDRDGFKLNVNNGTIDLRTGRLLEHDARDYITRIVPIDYDPLAASSIWQKVLHDALADEESIEFLQRVAGYLLTADASEEVFFMVIGPEASCKSTVFEALKAAMGDFSRTADSETFLEGRFEQAIRNDLARLHRARMVVASESAKGRRLASGLIKSITGGESIVSRFLRQEHFEHKPTWKLVLVTNFPPEISANDAGLWRRVIRINFDRTIPENERDPQIKRFLTDPDRGGPAVLAWMVQGCLMWQKDGLKIPPMIKKAAEDYRDGMDCLSEFLNAHVDVEPEGIIWNDELRMHYAIWATKEKMQTKITNQQMARRLKEKGCTSIRTESRRGWRGMKWKDSLTDDLTE